MDKKTVTITLDYDSWKEARRRKVNISGLFNDYLNEYLKRKKNGKLKAIILAAGMSSRMMELTDDKPKCMLEIGGKTLLQRQIEIFHQLGIDDVIIVRGWKSEKINYTGVRYVYNKNYRMNNILESLMVAKAFMNSAFIVSYSDILYKKEVVKRLMESKADISVIVDTDWTKAYENRFQHPIVEAEKVIVGNNKVLKIGKTLNVNKTYGEFIGLAKFSKKGEEALKKEYNRVKKTPNKPFHEARSLEKAYLTDMIQELIDKGHIVANVAIQGMWKELDTREDFRKAQKTLKW